MLPDPPSPSPDSSSPKPAAARDAVAPTPARRGSDRLAPVAQAAAGGVRSPAATPVPSAPPGHRAPRWPLPAVAALLAGSAAVLAAASAWLLAATLGFTPAMAAAVGAALALLAAAVPTLAVAMSRLRAAPAPQESAPVRDRDTGAFRPDVFMELAEREWARARRYGTGAGLLLVDLDKVPRLADAHGPAAADAFLTTLARHTSPTLRGADLVTRLTPTQLAVFLAQADPTGALDVAERIRERAEALDLAWPDGQAGAGKATRLRGTVSVGVAPLRPAHLNLQALVHDAEDAVAAARLAGGNCVRAAPVDASGTPLPGTWRDDHRARPQ